MTLRLDADEVAKHGLELAPCVEIVAALADDVELCIVLGGDGTILAALRRYAGTSVPVFAVIYGEVGFLATIDPTTSRTDFARAFARRLRDDRAAGDVGRAPRRHLERDQRHLRAPQGRPARGGPRVRARGRGGRPRALRRARDCHAAGSTGYNLANGGPVLAWGVEGYVVSFIAPHSLTARALVVAPDDELTINTRRATTRRRARRRAPALELPPGEDLNVELRAQPRHARADPGRVVLPAAARTFGRLAR